MAFTKNDVICAKHRLAQYSQTVLTMKDVATILAISTSSVSVYSNHKRPIIPRTKIKGSAAVLFDPKELEKTLETRADQLPTPNHYVNRKLLEIIRPKSTTSPLTPPPPSPQSVDTFAEAVADKVVAKLIAAGYVVKNTEGN